ncbi:FAD binding domain-containing protein [Nocardioidaceae bacterium]|nr:FAD binding domain-containing protein [Nocardioidaceae bacterium]
MDLHPVERFRTARTRDDLTLAPGETLLGGGTWLFSEPQPAVTGLVDLTMLGWEPVEHRDDGGVRLAATCPVATVRALGPAVCREAADALLMSWKVAEVATVGGNICLGLPAGAMTSLTAGLGGTALVWAADGMERELPVLDLVVGDGRTALAPGEVLRAVDLPPGWDDESAVAWRRASLTDAGRSAAVVVGRRTSAGPVVTVTASTPRPVVVREPADPAALEQAVTGPGGPGWFDDVHGAPDWRAAVTARLVAEVVEELS